MFLQNEVSIITMFNFNILNLLRGMNDLVVFIFKTHSTFLK